LKTIFESLAENEKLPKKNTMFILIYSFIFYTSKSTMKLKESGRFDKKYILLFLHKNKNLFQLIIGKMCSHPVQNSAGRQNCFEKFHNIQPDDFLYYKRLQSQVLAKYCETNQKGSWSAESFSSFWFFKNQI